MRFPRSAGHPTVKKHKTLTETLGCPHGVPIHRRPKVEDDVEVVPTRFKG